MALLGRLLGRSAEIRQEVAFHAFEHQRPDARLPIVGEASYQANLLRLAGDLGPMGPERRNQLALLMREPDNRYDRNAVAVYLVDESRSAAYKAGYLSRENAGLYGPVFAAINGRAVRATAELTGGWRRGTDQGHLGVELLALGTPAELLCELWADDHPPLRTHPWSDRLVAFTGQSRFTVGGVSIDRLGQQLLAQRAGCRTWPRVTRQVQVCVVSDPEDLTGNLRRAEDYGLDLVREADFWPGVGLQLVPG